MLRDSGEDTALVGAAFEAYFAARCEVEHYDDSVEALQRLAARVPMAALTNGNAASTRIGLMHLFGFQLGAREHGAAKPASSIFHAACRQLGTPPAQVLHVGDDVELDVVGAARAGLRTCWINRDMRDWPRDDLRPDLEFPTLAALADWLDAPHSTPSRRTPHDASARFRRRTRIADRVRCTWSIAPAWMPGACASRRPCSSGWPRTRSMPTAGSLLVLPGDDGVAARGAWHRRPPGSVRAMHSRRWRCRRATGGSTATWMRTFALRCNSAGAWVRIATRAFAQRRARRRGWCSIPWMTKPPTCWPPACACATWSTRRPSTWARTNSKQVVCEIAETPWRVDRGDQSATTCWRRTSPAIHAVGRASHRAPRLIELDWGDASHPHVAIVGKGVCFDTGGLSIKSADGMR